MGKLVAQCLLTSPPFPPRPPTRHQSSHHLRFRARSDDAGTRWPAWNDRLRNRCATAAAGSTPRRAPPPGVATVAAEAATEAPPAPFLPPSATPPGKEGRRATTSTPGPASGTSRRGRRPAAAAAAALPPVSRARVVITPPPPAAAACARLADEVADLRRRLAAARVRGGGQGAAVGVAAIEARLGLRHRRHGVATMRAKVGGVTRRLLALLAAAPPGKAAVFAHHTAMLAALAAALDARAIRHVTLSGATRAAGRAAAVDAFPSPTATPPVRVALLALRVAGAGVALPVADVMLFAECPWSAAEAAQAEGRAVRLGRRGGGAGGGGARGRHRR